MHQNKNINDELLELAASVSDNYKEAATLSSIALHELYQCKFFSDQYISYHLMERDNSGILTLSLGNNTYNGTSHKSGENEFSHDLFERVRKMLPVIKEDNDSLYQNDEDDGEYDFYKKTKKERYIRGSEKLLLKRLIDKVEQSNPDEFLKYIKLELSKDDKYLIRLRNILNERVLFEMLKADLSLTESQNECGAYDIKLYFPVEGESGSLPFKFDSPEYLDMNFISMDENHRKKPKELYKKLLGSSDYEFRAFLRDCQLKGEDIEEYMGADRKEAIKKILKSGNAIARVHLKESIKNRSKLLFRELFVVRKEGIAKRLKEESKDILSNKSIEDLKEINKDKLKVITDEVLRRYPFLNESKINVNEIKIEVTAARLKGYNFLSNDIEYYDEKSAFSLLDGLNNDEIKYNSLPLGGLNDYDKESYLKKELSKSKFSIVADGINYSDGFKLFNPNELSLQNGSCGFYINFNYKQHTIAKASLFLNNGKDLKIGTVEVARPFRGQGLSYYIYDKLSDIAIRSDKPIITGSYTTDGKIKLPSVKDSISERKDRAVFLSETEYGLNRYSMPSREDFLTSLVCEVDKESSLSDIVKMKKLVFENWDKIEKEKEKIEDRGGDFENIGKLKEKMLNELVVMFNEKESEVKISRGKKVKPM